MALFILETKLGRRLIVFLVIRLYINTDEQTDHLSARPSFSFISSGRMVRLFARIYTQTDYQTNYRSFPKFIPDG